MSAVLSPGFATTLYPDEESVYHFPLYYSSQLLLYRPALVCDPGSCLLAQLTRLRVVSDHDNRTLLNDTPFSTLWPLTYRRSARACLLPLTVEGMPNGSVSFRIKTVPVPTREEAEEQLVRYDSEFFDDRDLLVGYLNPVHRWLSTGMPGRNPPGWPIRITILIFPLDDPAVAQLPD